MAKKVEERIKSIEIALTNEIRERDFYLKHSRRTSNPLGKKMFDCIAKDEEEHCRRLNDLQRKLSKEGKWPETLPLTVNQTNVKDVLKDVLAKVDKAPVAEIDDQEAVKIAIDFEARGHKFYADLRDSVEDKAEKEFYDRLASMEMEHMLSLKDTLLFFEDPATWYEEQEKPHLDGG